jgi:MATE family multidrug resistance protein
MEKSLEAAPAAVMSPWALLRHHLWGTARLAGPVMVARSGSLLMITADVIMTGRAGAGELAYYGLGLAPAQVLFVVGLGYLIGTMVLSAQAEGQGNRSLCGAIWSVGLAHALVVGVGFALVVVVAGEPFFLLAGQEPDLARGGAEVLRMFAWGLPGVLLHVATAFFLEGISRPKANMVLMILANLANIGLNWALIYDHGAFAGMGGQGAALATSITRWLMWFGLAGYALLMPAAARYGIRRPLGGRGGISRKLFRMGVPVGLAHGLEAGAFMTLVMFAGLLGALPLAVYQIAQSIFTTVYMLAIGVATATSVRVGNAAGRADRGGVAWAGWVGFALALAVLFPVMGLLQGFPTTLAGVYSTDPRVLQAAYHSIVVVSFFIVVDGAQGVVVGALRGAGDVWPPTGMVTAGFWGVSVPFAYYSAFSLSWGVDGLLWGLFAGALVATVFLLLRLRHVARREVRPY